MVELAPASEGLFSKGYAGDTFNTAWYARRLGVRDIDVNYLTAVGDDQASAEMIAFMRREGVTPIEKKVPGRTVGLYMISLQDGERSFSYWRSASAAKQLAENMAVLPLVGGGDIAYFSGITLAILEERTRDDFLTAIGAARKNGVLIAFDPNLRPRLWNNNDEMCHWTTLGAASADIVLPSFDDEAAHFSDRNKLATAERYLRGGANLAVVKDADDHVLIVSTNKKMSKVSPTPIKEVVDSTAAGDAFNAGFLVETMRGESPESAAKTGCELSAKVISGRGALVAF